MYIPSRKYEMEELLNMNCFITSIRPTEKRCERVISGSEQVQYTQSTDLDKNFGAIFGSCTKFLGVFWLN